MAKELEVVEGSQLVNNIKYFDFDDIEVLDDLIIRLNTESLEYNRAVVNNFRFPLNTTNDVIGSNYQFKHLEYNLLVLSIPKNIKYVELYEASGLVAYRITDLDRFRPPEVLVFALDTLEFLNIVILHELLNYSHLDDFTILPLQTSDTTLITRDFNVATTSIENFNVFETFGIDNRNYTYYLGSQYFDRGENVIVTEDNQIIVTEDNKVLCTEDELSNADKGVV